MSQAIDKTGNAYQWRYYKHENLFAIRRALELGCNRHDAAIAGNIDDELFRTWMKVFPDFKQMVERAEVARKILWLGTIRNAMADDWRAAKFLLERVYPQEFGVKAAMPPESDLIDVNAIKQSLASRLAALIVADAARSVPVVVDADGTADNTARLADMGATDETTA